MPHAPTIPICRPECSLKQVPSVKTSSPLSGVTTRILSAGFRGRCEMSTGCYSGFFGISWSTPFNSRDTLHARQEWRLAQVTLVFCSESAFSKRYGQLWHPSVAREAVQIYLTAVARSCSPLKVDQCPLAVMCFLTGAGSLPEAGGNMSHPQTSTIVDRWKLSAPKCDDSLVTEIKTIQNL